MFQHPFIAGACDSRPILQLLSEAKAEVVEEIEDIDESSVSHTEPINRILCDHVIVFVFILLRSCSFELLQLLA